MWVSLQVLCTGAYSLLLSKCGSFCISGGAFWLHPCQQQKPQIPFTSVEIIDSLFSLGARGHGVHLQYSPVSLKASLQAWSGKFAEIEQEKEQKRES